MNLLLLCHNEWHCRNILRCIDPAGRRIYVMATNAESPIRYSRRIRGFEVQDLPLEGSALAEAAARFRAGLDRARIDLVVPCDLEATLFIRAAGDTIGSTPVLPIPDVATIEMLHDKWRFYQFLHDSGLPAPHTVMLRDPRDVQTIPFAFPAIVKPPAEGGGSGIRVFDRPEELSDYLARDDLAFGLPLIAQEFLPGTDIDYSLLARDGEVVAWAVQSWHDSNVLRFTDDARVHDIGRDIIRRTGFHGLAHFDMRIDDRDGAVKVIECNPRFWESVAASMWIGTNFVELAIQSAIAETPPGSVAPSIGDYEPNSAFIRRALRGKASVREFLTHDYRPILQNLKDPLPTLVCMLQNARYGRPLLSRAL